MCSFYCKSYSHFSSKIFQHICVSLDVNFNESLTNDIVSFEQLGPEVLSLYKPYCRKTKILKNNQPKKMAAVVVLVVVVVILVVEVVEIVVVVIVVVVEVVVVVVVVVVVCWCSCWKTEAALYFEVVMVIVIEIVLTLSEVYPFTKFQVRLAREKRAVVNSDSQSQQRQRSVNKTCPITTKDVVMFT